MTNTLNCSITMTSTTVGIESLEARVQQLLKTMAKEEGFSEPTFAVSSGSKNGFIGVVNRVLVEDKHRASLSVIVKSQPKNEALCLELGVDQFFILESTFYNVIRPAFVSFQKEKGITDNFAPSSPKCYHASTTAIVMEDMSPCGYVLLNHKEELDLDHCTKILRELGRMHAVSFALRDQQPQLYRQITKNMKEAFLVPKPNPNMKQMYDNAVKNALEKFKGRAVVNNKKRYEKIFEKFTIDYYDTLLMLVDAKSAEPYAVINHGDCWNNNFLFKYDKGGKSPAGICLLDYQLVRHCSPATDVSYFLFCCLSKATRDEHFDGLLAEYYTALTDYIRLLGSDPERVFPLATFHDQLKRFGKYGLGLAVFEIPIFTSDSCGATDSESEREGAGDSNPSDGAAKSSLEKNFNISHSNEDVCWSRINHVIIDMIDKGYIV